MCSHGLVMNTFDGQGNNYTCRKLVGARSKTFPDLLSISVHPVSINRNEGHPGSRCHFPTHSFFSPLLLLHVFTDGYRDDFL